MFGAARFIHGLLITLGLPHVQSGHVDAHRDATDPSVQNPPGATHHEARVVHNITDTLSSLCLISAWTNPTSPLDETCSLPSLSDYCNDATRIPAMGREEAASAPDATVPAAVPEETASARFMSFEDWKEMMLRQAGQDPQDLRRRSPSEHNAGDRVAPEMANFGLGEEGEISLDFGNLNEADGERSAEATAAATADDSYPGETGLTQSGRSSSHQSKDAGKTCKERFSYSSFDAGATILKTGPATKNAKAILVENKDSYMLLECATQTKYVIVELSDDILVDTVVIANFEFFSSMVRQFRVSVSDRYPVKMEKWRELGTFEARNSRDIQPFLVENPQIWAKYLRVEFLTHYSKEFYCPVSLLRVHGTRMLDSWKDSETGSEEDTIGEEERRPEEQTVEEQQTVVPAMPVHQDSPKAASNKVIDVELEGCCPTVTSLLLHTYSNTSAATCAARPLVLDDASSKYSQPPPAHSDEQIRQSTSIVGSSDPTPSPLDVEVAAVSDLAADHPTSSIQTSASGTTSIRGIDERSSPSTTAISVPAPPLSEASGNATASASKTSNPSVSGGKTRSSSTTGSPAASPTVQEGFFNAITKRLHQVETNLTLSLQYIEDQSRQMQDVLHAAEQKQVSSVTYFLDSLNQTVLAELRSVRDQSDQMWQSTMAALDIQREQSERDIVALSARLNLLADEVVFQKRMAIVQAVLLLSCLLLVIFSRGVPIASFTPLLEPSTFAPRVASASFHQRNAWSSQLGHDTQHGDQSPVGVERGAPFDGASGDGRMAATESDLTPSDQYPVVHVVDPGTSLAYQRLSPPLSPGPSDYAGQDMVANGHDSDVAFTRRGSASQQNHIRKPLPALPEHPSSP